MVRQLSKISSFKETKSGKPPIVQNPYLWGGIAGAVVIAASVTFVCVCVVAKRKEGGFPIRIQFRLHNDSKVGVGLSKFDIISDLVLLYKIGGGSLGMDFWIFFDPLRGGLSSKMGKYNRCCKRTSKCR